MSDIGWSQFALAAFGGGLTVKLLDLAYIEIRRHFDSSKSAKQFVDEHLDPLLKAADELVGKLCSLAEQDFKALHDVEPFPETVHNHDYSGLLYLFARFWARVEIFRQEGLSIEIAKDRRGKYLQNFLDCLESRRVRIIDRISQRAIGEMMISHEPDGRMKILPFVQFIRLFETDQSMRRWLEPLAVFISQTQSTRERQQLLQNCAILHALIDTLDQNHDVTKERPFSFNKLSKRSWRDLKYRVFGVYLKFVKKSEKYTGPPK